MEEERIAHEQKLAKIKAEMRAIFEAKVREKEAKLKQSEEEVKHLPPTIRYPLADRWLLAALRLSQTNEGSTGEATPGAWREKASLGKWQTIDTRQK